MRFTAHSEFDKLDTLFIKRAADAFVNDSMIENDWQALHFLDKPDWELALKEYEQFESVLKTFVKNIYYLPQREEVNMDSIYCRDAAIATNKGMIICNMGKPGRINEPSAQKKAFEMNGLRILGEISAPGTLEGGDVAWLNEHTLAVGHTYRTNDQGIDQLRALLRLADAELIRVPLPHYRGPSDVFHLMSIFSPVNKQLAVVYSPLMPIEFREKLLAFGYDLIEVPPSEFDSMGCNVLALAPSFCLMVKGNPLTKKALEKAGCRVIEYEGSEISVKGGGGPTCLTRPVLRYADQ